MSDNEESRVSDPGAIIPPSKEFADVRAFHQKFGLMCFDTPGHLTLGKLRERIEFMQEELNEFVDASGLYLHVDPTLSGYAVTVSDGEMQTTSQDLAKQADALVDLVYVALGTAVMLGLPWDWLWNDVHRANMAKERGVTHRGHAVDVMKPPGWQGPQGQRILELAGYKGDFTTNQEKCRDDTQR